MIIMTCRNVALTAMSGGWLLINGADQEQMEAEGEEVIADICLLARKEKVPSGFTVVSFRAPCCVGERDSREVDASFLSSWSKP